MQWHPGCALSVEPIAIKGATARAEGILNRALILDCLSAHEVGAERRPLLLDDPATALARPNASRIMGLARQW